MTEAARRLRDGEVQVVLARRPAVLDDGQLRVLSSGLSNDERSRASAIEHRARRDAFIVGRALLREALSAYAPNTAPSDWSITLGPFGKPRLRGSDLWCSISHTDALTAVALASSPVGIDVEQPGSVSLAVVTEFYSSREQRALARRPVARQREHATVLWTLKEAYAKACELSLDEALRGVDFAPRRFRLRPGRPGGWRFAHPDLGADVVAAVALELPYGRSMRLRVGEREIGHASLSPVR